MTTPPDPNRGYKELFKVFILLIVIIAVWASWPFIIATLFTEWPVRGQFGDMFGGLNSLFSGFAFAGIIVAIWLQRKELQLQREELQATREELKRAAKAQEASQEALSKQADILLASAQLNALNNLYLNYSHQREIVTGTSAHAIAKQTDLEKKKKESFEKLEKLSELVSSRIDLKDNKQKPIAKDGPR